MTERSSIFDMIGPVMIGPSSSHTAGVVRIGRFTRKILGVEPEEVTIIFYNSFATTYEGHGSDRAVLAGLMDFNTDDDRVREALHIAAERNIVVHFKSIMSAPKLHPNSIRVSARAGDRTVETLGVSRGGGLITIAEIDGFHANLAGQSDTLIVLADDVKGSIAFISSVVAHDDCNIATMIVTRRAKNNFAKLIMELDSEPKSSTIDYLRTLSWVKEALFVAGKGL